MVSEWFLYRGQFFFNMIFTDLNVNLFCMKKLKVLELFACVGGFRIGLEKTNKFEVIWSNQWEPSTKKQHASEVYESVFGKENHSNEDIHLVPTSQIPDGDVLVGGFPCQDYSVATTLKN